MVGTGVFTTTGFLIRDVGSPPAILLGWLLGGVLALLGALCYAELAAALPGNGGEYHLLSRVYHPALGFVAGWTSLVVGFSAPAAAAALACARYLATLAPGLPHVPIALALLVLAAGLHAFRVETGASIQNVATALQVLLIVALVAAGVANGQPERLCSPLAVPLGDALLSSGFAVGLIYIAFSYSGWNAAVYVAGEIERPERTLPRACAAGSVLVAALYLALNVTFLMSAPAAALAGKVEVGAIAAEHLFGPAGRALVVGLIAIGLFTTLSALTMTGPRIYEAMGRDYPRLAALRDRAGGRGGPRKAIALQTGLSLLLVFAGDVDALLSYCGFTLTLFAALVVFGVVVLRLRAPDLARPYRAFGYPLTPLLFVTLALWMIAHSVVERPAAAFWGALTPAVGVLLYAWLRPRARVDVP